MTTTAKKLTMKVDEEKKPKLTRGTKFCFTDFGGLN